MYYRFEEIYKPLVIRWALRGKVSHIADVGRPLRAFASANANDILCGTI